MSFKDHFSGHAENYARYRPGYPAELYQALADLCLRRELAWDCACGNGQASLPLTQHFDRVVGTDASQRQIESAPETAGVEFRTAAAEASGFEDSSVDLVTVAQALHWFDTTRFYRELDRTLRPGGIAAAWAYPLCRISDKVDALLDYLYEDLTGSYWPPERRHIEDGYASLDYPQPRLAMEEFAMRASWSAEDALGYLGTWSAVQRYTNDTGENPIDEIAGNLRHVWGASHREVVWPLTLLVWQKPS